MPLQIVLPHHLADLYGAQIREVCQEELELVAIHGNDSGDPDVSQAEIALHGFWFGLTPFRQILPNLDNVKWIHITGAGIDDVASPELMERRVWITNVSGGYAEAMAEYALASMTLLGRGWGRWITAQREHRWLDRESTSGNELRGKRLGIVGYGGVGRHLARACKAIGMEVWATCRRPMFISGEPLDRLLLDKELHELLAHCDYIVITASLNSTTRGLLGDKELSQIKPGAFIVNVSRGELLDQDALIRSLESGRVGGAVLDVVTPEPLPPDSSLWETPNLWITPHVSGDTPEGWQRGIDLFCANLQVYIQGHPERMANIIDLSEHL